MLLAMLRNQVKSDHQHIGSHVLAAQLSVTNQRGLNGRLHLVGGAAVVRLLRLLQNLCNFGHAFHGEISENRCSVKSRALAGLLLRNAFLLTWDQPFTEMKTGIPQHRIHLMGQSEISTPSFSRSDDVAAPMGHAFVLLLQNPPISGQPVHRIGNEHRRIGPTGHADRRFIAEFPGIGCHQSAVGSSFRYGDRYGTVFRLRRLQILEPAGQKRGHFLVQHGRLGIDLNIPGKTALFPAGAVGRNGQHIAAL